MDQSKINHVKNQHSIVPTLTAKKTLLVESLLQNTDKLLKAIQILPEGHVHVVLPQQITSNIELMKKNIHEHGLEPRIFVSHKPSKSSALIKQARAEGVGLDVSSKNELISALKNGFSGQFICCTGSKNNDYMTLSIQHNCLHSIDSIEELERYINLQGIIAPKERRDILLRINSEDAPYGGKATRFGIRTADINSCLKLLKENSLTHIEGYHMHSGENSGDLRAQEVTLMLGYMQQAYEQGFTPKTINIGGGFPRTFYESKDECDTFIETLIQSLYNKTEIAWRGFKFGLSVNEKQAISGRDHLTSAFKRDDFECTIQKLLKSSSLDSTVAKVIGECDFSLMLEPGLNAFDGCGLSLFKIVEIQEKGGQTITILDGNKYQLQFEQIEYMADPILLSNEIDDNETFTTYLAGNLCADFDIMVKRKVAIQGTPKPGDYLCFINTAGYTADFHDASVHQHPTGQKIVALQENNDWHFSSEDRFNPYISLES